MKFPLITTASLALCAFAATAQAEMKVASVNMQELYKSYHKRFDAEKRLGEQKAAVEKEIAQRAEKIKAMAEELNKIRQQVDPSLSDAAKQKIQAEFSTKLNTAQAAEQEFTSFRQHRQVAFQEMQKHEILIILQDIQQQVDEAASKDNYDLVIDSGAVAPPLGTKIFPFVKKSYDITPELMKKINAGAPAGFDPASATGAAAQ